MGDNQVFNVNGSGDEALLDTLKLIFKLRKYKCVGWTQSKTHGLILHWTCNLKGDVFKLPGDGLNADECFGLVKKWLCSDFADDVEPSAWCEDSDHDGCNSQGWQVYVENWGHVDGHQSAICAIKKAYIWHGK